MRIQQLHSWDLTPQEAVALQRELAGRIEATTPLGRCKLVAGADVSYNLFSSTFYAAVIVWRIEDATIVERQTAIGECSFPYVPGLLSFREAPILLQAFAKLSTLPDAVMVDGQGYAHPRRFGIACHLGLFLGVPTVGCGKSRLLGTYKEPGKKAGSSSLLYDGKEVIGRVVRTRDGVKPVFVSVGHRLDLASAVQLVLQCRGGYRIPEPTRQAHLQVNELRRQGKPIPG